MARSPDVDGVRVTPFLTKTYQLVDDRSTDEIISWNSDGSSFVVWRPAEFARDILPLFFKHNNLSSFVRQLNTYGFRKVSDRWEFINENFKRGEKRLLNDIRRRKKLSPTRAAAPGDSDRASTNSSEEPISSGGSPSPQAVQSANSASAATSSSSAHLEEENNRLRQENKRLSHELGHMKKVCSNIFNLVNGLNSSAHNKGVNSSSTPSINTMQLLDLMPSNELSHHDHDSGEGSSTRLFGVSIRTKRFRNGTNDEMDLDMNSGSRTPGTDPSD